MSETHIRPEIRAAYSLIRAIVPLQSLLLPPVISRFLPPQINFFGENGKLFQKKECRHALAGRQIQEKSGDNIVFISFVDAFSTLQAEYQKNNSASVYLIIKFNIINCQIIQKTSLSDGQRQDYNLR